MDAPVPGTAGPTVAGRAELTRDIGRGVARHLGALGQACLAEFMLRNGRRVDLIALDRDGRVTIVEVKSSVADFRADRKWRDYLPFCDRFYFAVAAAFPRDLVPGECGLIVADAYGAAMLREATPGDMNAARRRALTLRFAHMAGGRLTRLTDPMAAEPDSTA